MIPKGNNMKSVRPLPVEMPTKVESAKGILLAAAPAALLFSGGMQ
jgi:hypothetical protein